MEQIFLFDYFKIEPCVKRAVIVSIIWNVDAFSLQSLAEETRWTSETILDATICVLIWIFNSKNWNLNLYQDDFEILYYQKVGNIQIFPVVMWVK